MRYLAMLIMMVASNDASADHLAKVSVQSVHVYQTFEHGGGCRKSSPAGQCCHMDRKRGTVHCH